MSRRPRRWRRRAEREERAALIAGVLMTVVCGGIVAVMFVASVVVNTAGGAW